MSDEAEDKSHFLTDLIDSNAKLAATYYVKVIDGKLPKDLSSRLRDLLLVTAKEAFRGGYLQANLDHWRRMDAASGEKNQSEEKD